MSSLDIDAIRDYLLNAGCKIEYPILVNAFKKYLYNPDPNVQGRIRNQFKDYVNRLATVSLENNMKFIILRPEFRQVQHENQIKENFRAPDIPTRKPEIIFPATAPRAQERHTHHDLQSTVRDEGQAKNCQNQIKPVYQQPSGPPPVPLHYRQSSLDDTQHRIQQTQQYGSQSSMHSLSSNQQFIVQPIHHHTQPQQYPYQQPDQQRQPLVQRPQQHVSTPRPAVANRRHPYSLQSSIDDSGASDTQDGCFKVPQMPPPPIPVEPKPLDQAPTVARRLNQLPRPESLDGNSNFPAPPPRPPPRRRQSTASLFKQVSKPIEKCSEIQDLANKSPGRVREHALKLSSSASTSDLKALLPMRSNTMKENRLSRDINFGHFSHQRSGSQSTSRSKSSHREDESDSSSLQPLDPLRRKWAIEACNCNYNGLLALLKEDPKLAGYKDITNRYTALHWASKFGNLDIIKLIAGTHGVSANSKSSAGYTPLHIAYMFNRIEAADLLMKSYNANPNVRDYSGKKPMQYWQSRLSKSCS